MLGFLTKKVEGLHPDYKPQVTKKRKYAGAQISRLLNDFVAQTLSADSEIRNSLRLLRNRSRDLSRNNDYVRRYFQILKSNVIGPSGIQLQVRARNDNGALDVLGNRIVEEAFRKWGRKGICTVDGRLSWCDAQAMFMEMLARDGEVLCQLVKNRGVNNFGFAIHFLESDVLDEEYNQRLQNGNIVKMGVELDTFNRPIAYHLLEEHPGEQVLKTGTNRRRRRVPASDILHVYMQERAGQTRGVPMLSSAITRLKHLDAYEESELVAARVASAKMGFFLTPDPEGYIGEDLEDDYAPIMSAEPGTFEQLPAGMDFKTFDPEHPVSAFADFEKAILRGIASGLGVSYCSLANDLTGVNYSSIRQGVMEDRDHFRCLQTFVIEHFIRPVFENWLLMAMTTNAINLPVRTFDKFFDASVFRPRGFAWIDPLKEVQSSVVSLQNGFTTLQDVANSQGRDVEDIFQQIEAEKALAERFGIELAFEPLGAKSPAYSEVKDESE